MNAYKISKLVEDHRFRKELAEMFMNNNNKKDYNTDEEGKEDKKDK